MNAIQAPRPELGQTFVPEPRTGPFRVQCVHCHHDNVHSESPETCPSCGDVRICVTTPDSAWQALRDRLRAEFEWTQLRDRVRNR